MNNENLKDVLEQIKDEFDPKYYNEEALRMKFEEVVTQINMIVNWNFGYCPVNNTAFDKALEKRSDILETAKYFYPDLYDELMDILDNQR